MSYPTHSNHLGSHYQTIPLFDVRHGPGWKGERVGNKGLFGIFQQPTYASDSTWVDSRGVIVQIVQHWGCQPGDGWLPVRNFRDAHISSRVEGFITGSGHVYTGITFPVHHLCEEENSWVVVVDCKALFIPALTETTVGILGRIGLVWDDALERYTAPLDGTIDGITCRGPSGTIIPERPVWEVKRCIRFRHSSGNASGCLDMSIVHHVVHPVDGERQPLDLMSLY